MTIKHILSVALCLQLTAIGSSKKIQNNRKVARKIVQNSPKFLAYQYPNDINLFPLVRNTTKNYYKLGALTGLYQSEGAVPSYNTIVLDRAARLAELANELDYAKSDEEFFAITAKILKILRPRRNGFYQDNDNVRFGHGLLCATRTAAGAKWKIEGDAATLLSDSGVDLKTILEQNSLSKVFPEEDVRKILVSAVKFYNKKLESQVPEIKKLPYRARAALISLAYSGGKNVISPKLQRAIKNYSLDESKACEVIHIIQRESCDAPYWKEASAWRAYTASPSLIYPVLRREAEAFIIYSNPVKHALLQFMLMINFENADIISDFFKTRSSVGGKEIASAIHDRLIEPLAAKSNEADLVRFRELLYRRLAAKIKAGEVQITPEDILALEAAL